MSACSNVVVETAEEHIIPRASQVKSICELATMQCYYHNVAKYYAENAEKVFINKYKDRKFWVEYSGVVTIGVDTSLVSMDVDGDVVTITVPPAKVLNCKVDEKTLNEDSFIIAKDSAKVEAEHQTKAFKDAQKLMYEAANNDKNLLSNAQARLQKLLEDYVNNIGTCTGKSYTIKWIYIDDENADTVTVNEKTEADVSTETTETAGQSTAN